MRGFSPWARMAVVTDLEVAIPAWRQDGGGRGYAARGADRRAAPQGRENGARECDEEGGCMEEGERSSERERRTRTDDPEI